MKQALQKPAVRSTLALFCCLLWGSAFPCVKIGYEWLNISTTGSQILFAGYRFLLAGILTFLVGCIMEKRILTMKKASLPYVLRQGVLQTTIQYVFFYVGMSNTTGSKGSVINASNAFIAIIAAHFLMKDDKMTWRKAFGCIIGFAGIILINLEPGAWGSGFSFKGEGMMMICAITYGMSTVVMKLISHMESSVTITAYQLIFGGLILVIVGKIAQGAIQTFDAKSLLLLCYMALLSAVAFTLWALLLKYNPVAKVSIYGCSIPVFGVALSALVLGENIWSIKNLIALLCVGAGIVVVNGFQMSMPCKKGPNTVQ